MPRYSSQSVPYGAVDAGGAAVAVGDAPDLVRDPRFPPVASRGRGEAIRSYAASMMALNVALGRIAVAARAGSNR